MSLKTVCKVLGNEERIQLIACLAREQSVSTLLAKCTLSQSALSQHLALLRTAGAVTVRQKGTYRYYRARPEYVACARTLSTLVTKAT